MADTPKATVCPKDYCRALIPATSEDRAAHLAGHASDKKATTAMRDELIAMRTLIAELKNDNREFRTELRAIEIPEPTDPLLIEEWPDDELPDDDDEPEQTSQYLDDITPPATITNPIAGEPIEDAADYPPAIDRDDPPTTNPPRVDMYGNLI